MSSSWRGRGNGGGKAVMGVETEVTDEKNGLRLPSTVTRKEIGRCDDGKSVFT